MLHMHAGTLPMPPYLPSCIESLILFYTVGTSSGDVVTGGDPTGEGMAKSGRRRKGSKPQASGSVKERGCVARGVAKEEEKPAGQVEDTDSKGLINQRDIILRG